MDGCDGPCEKGSEEMLGFCVIERFEANTRKTSQALVLEPKRRKLRTGEPKACKDPEQKTWKVHASLKKRTS